VCLLLKVVDLWIVTMYSYIADASDVFRDISIAELDKDTEQARMLLKRVKS